MNQLTIVRPAPLGFTMALPQEPAASTSYEWIVILLGAVAAGLVLYKTWKAGPRRAARRRAFKAIDERYKRDLEKLKNKYGYYN